MMAIGKNIRFHRKVRLGWTLEKLEELSGVDRGTISALENRDSSKSDHFYAIAKAMGITVEHLTIPPDQWDLLSGTKRAIKNEEIDLVDNEDYPAIKRVNLKLSAGISGFSIDYDIEDKTPIVMRKEWFESRGYKPNKLLAVEVKGESMQNGLFDGDTVVINTADTKPIDGEVFAINYEGEMLIKRMVRDSGIWWLSSDNTDQRKFPRKECSGDMCLVVGRIVHKQSERI